MRQGVAFQLGGRRDALDCSRVVILDRAKGGNTTNGQIIRLVIFIQQVFHARERHVKGRNPCRYRHQSGDRIIGHSVGEHHIGVVVVHIHRGSHIGQAQRIRLIRGGGIAHHYCMRQGVAFQLGGRRDALDCSRVVILDRARPGVRTIAGIATCHCSSKCECFIRLINYIIS